MALSGQMTPIVAVAFVAAYAMVSAEVFLATHAEGTFRLAFAGIGPTELRIVLAVGIVQLSVRPVVEIAGHTWRLLDVGGVVAIAGLAVAFVVSALRNTRALYMAERLDR